MTRDEAIEALRGHRRALDRLSAATCPDPADFDLSAPIDEDERRALEVLGETAERARDARAWLLEHLSGEEFERICAQIRDESLGARRKPE